MDISVYKGNIKQHGAELDIESETVLIHKRHAFWIIGMVTHEQLHASIFKVAGKKACLQFDNLIAFWSDVYEDELGVEEHCFDYNPFYNDNERKAFNEQQRQQSLDKWLEPNESYSSVVRLSNPKEKTRTKSVRQFNCQISDSTRVSTVKVYLPYRGGWEVKGWVLGVFCF